MGYLLAHFFPFNVCIGFAFCYKVTSEKIIRIVEISGANHFLSFADFSLFFRKRNAFCALTIFETRISYPPISPYSRLRCAWKEMKQSRSSRCDVFVPACFLISFTSRAE